MSNVMRVAILDDADHLSKEYAGITFCEISFSFEPSEEFAALAVAD